MPTIVLGPKMGPQRCMKKKKSDINQSDILVRQTENILEVSKKIRTVYVHRS